MRKPTTLTSACVLSTADEDAAHSVTQMSLVVIATQRKHAGHHIRTPVSNYESIIFSTL